MDYYELAQNELKESQYETFNQFYTVMDSAFNGTFSQAGEFFNRYGFSAHSYTDQLVEYCEDFINDNVLIECLKDLAVIVEIANKLKIYELERQNIANAITIQSLN